MYLVTNKPRKTDRKKSSRRRAKLNKKAKKRRDRIYQRG